MNRPEYLIAVLQEAINDQDALIQQLSEVPETLGNAEDVVVDDAAMTLLRQSIEDVIAQIRQSQEKLRQASK